MKKETIKGALFEILVLKFVLMSGYRLIDESMVDENRIKVDRKRFAEFRGRGEWHQIDIPVELINQPSLIYPIRLLGEVKCYKDPIDKSFIREEIGKMKDIQENYFADPSISITEQMKRDRRLEVFSFFSASGFNDSAERLAYAHGIRTISYSGNECASFALSLLDSIADFVSDISDSEQAAFIDKFFDYLILQKEDEQDYDSDLFLDKTIQLEHIIKTSIIGTTSSGLTINFLSYDEFPDRLFIEKDYAYCQIHSSENDHWFLTIRNSNIKLHFSMPELAKGDFFEKNGIKIYPKKAILFENISFQRTINNCKRSLEFRFDHEWFSLINDDN